MKRLFGLTGIIYLATLTAVFYFKSPFIYIAAAVCAVALIASGIYKRFKHNRYLYKTFVISGVTIIAAALSIFLYQNYYIKPITDNYSDKEIYVEGYICDEILKQENKVEYLIKTTSINSKPVFTKLKYTGYSESEVKEFDRVTLSVKAYAESSERNIGHRILLRAYETSPENIVPTGEKKFSLYKYAVDARKEIRKAVGRLLPADSAELSRAILLGDKYKLSDSLMNDFARTGTSYLIVVSGLHLSIAVTVIMSVIKRFTKRGKVLSVCAIITVFGFSALTGFNYSVIRAAIALTIYYTGRIFFKANDPLNSLGFAALAITITNPCAVGDLGLLLSFSSTMGIILWHERIKNYILNTTRIRKIKAKSIFIKRIKSILYFFTELISVSVSASLWVLPITITAFGTFYPAVVITAVFTEPLASAILVLSLACSVFCLFPIAPVITYLIAFTDNIFCKWLIAVNSFFSKLPVSSVKADSEAVYIWLAVTVILVIIGYVIKAKKRYTVAAINISFALMLTLVSVSYLTADKSCRLTVYQSGGVCVEVKKESNLSLLSVGGNNRIYKELKADIIDSYGEVDNIIIPCGNNYSSLLPDITEEYRVINLIGNSESADSVKTLSTKGPDIMRKETIQKVRLNSEADVTLINTDGIMYQYINCVSFTALFLPVKSDAKKLPKQYRTADYVILDGIPKNYNLLDCKSAVYTENTGSYYQDRNKILNEITKNNVILNNKKIEIP